MDMNSQTWFFFINSFFADWINRRLNSAYLYIDSTNFRSIFCIQFIHELNFKSCVLKNHSNLQKKIIFDSINQYEISIKIPISIFPATFKICWLNLYLNRSVNVLYMLWLYQYGFARYKSKLLSHNFENIYENQRYLRLDIQTILSKFFE